MLRLFAVCLLSFAAAVAQDSDSTTLAAYSSSVTTKVPAEPAEPNPQFPGVDLSSFCDPEGDPRRNACRFRWKSALVESTQFLAIQHVMNMSTYKGRLQGSFFHDWVNSVDHYRFTRWHDDDPFIVDYIGHPMMGAVVGRIQVQNDPIGARQQVGKNKRYWKSRAKALAWATVYSAQWELGPVSETSIGNLGSFEYYSESTGHNTNGTGLTDLITTPVAGTIWLIGEDLIDRYAIQRLERVSTKRGYLAAISILNPTRSLANVLAWKVPWHRDTRRVR